MRPDEVRAIFERVDAMPSARFSEDLLDRLRAQYQGAGVDRIDTFDPTTAAPTVIDVLPAAAPTSHRNRRRIAWAAAVAAAVIVIITVVGRAANDEGVELGPAGPGPVTKMDPTFEAPFQPTSALPDGLKGLPPEGAVSSTPESGRLLADLPMPIWVYEDGRVISARWTTHSDWTGFLEQRLTPEGVKLVQDEIATVEPNRDYCSAGGPGGYGYFDPGREVCEHAVINAESQMWGDVYPRLTELPYGARSWLPASAWIDPDPKPFVPSRYAVDISSVHEPNTVPPPVELSAALAQLPPEAADLLGQAERCTVSLDGFAPGGNICLELSTEDARHVASSLGMGEQTENDADADSGVARTVRGNYNLAFLPYLPHDAPVGCCGG